MTMAGATTTLRIGADSAAPSFAFDTSRNFEAWLFSQNISLAFTTYEIGKIFTVGISPQTQLKFSERSFPRPMGLGVHDNGFWAGTMHQVWRFDNYLAPGAMHKGHDALYMPSMAFTTGDVDVHDIHMQGDSPLFVATQFNCIAEPVPGKSFRAVWRPPFIDRLAAEDRCHLNGMAIADGVLRYVTCVATTNLVGGWRERRRDGGVVLDVETGEAVATGLSMPHSPRLHDGRLWLLQSGTGELGHVDLATGRFEPVCFFPGFARGLAIHGDFAVVGVSLPREKTKDFQGLALQDRLRAEKVSPRCMIAIVNLRTGDLEHSIEVGAPIAEIYDVAILPGIRNPQLIGLQKDDIRFIVNPDPGSAFDPKTASQSSRARSADPKQSKHEKVIQ